MIQVAGKARGPLVLGNDSCRLFRAMIYLKGHHTLNRPLAITEFTDEQLNPVFRSVSFNDMREAVSCGFAVSLITINDIAIKKSHNNEKNIL